MSWTDDPIADYDRYDADQSERLDRLPECCMCGEHIQQDDAVCIDGDWYCDECIHELRRSVDDYED